jgi:hypothetical protein
MDPFGTNPSDPMEDVLAMQSYPTAGDEFEDSIMTSHCSGTSLCTGTTGCSGTSGCTGTIGCVNTVGCGPARPTGGSSGTQS